ncbi:hypothetical protein HELRODRAFT_175938 [Helobdella robusta]|uniref:Uncharacterized protein n=1 Tax=Helobdella robusta TaxID=6412 RepID=T1F9X8_HELRO|nr:hypothetical protein HELRODRAFT_175938 [Helobdella robusta]ESO00500.1 hypothetical protein HELRODRAFT_175938 [Helobdella robusta]
MTDCEVQKLAEEGVVDGRASFIHATAQKLTMKNYNDLKIGLGLLNIRSIMSKYEMVANAEKQLIVEAMTAVDSDWSVRGVKYPATELEQVKSKPLHDLVSGTSRAALLSLGMDVAILRETEPDSWNDLPLFQKVANVVKSLKVVNDTAERTVALMTNFNQSITKNETELQKLIQVVEDNRTRIPDFSKRTLPVLKQLLLCFEFDIL